MALLNFFSSTVYCKCYCNVSLEPGSKFSSINTFPVPVPILPSAARVHNEAYIPICQTQCGEFNG